jgi:hypothetical protein
MPLVRQIRSVWVPFWVNSHNEEITNVADNVPRFLHPEECKDFIQLNAYRLKRKIQFQERFEDEFKQEFARGVGRLSRWRYGPVYGPETIPEERRSLRDYD